MSPPYPQGERLLVAPLHGAQAIVERAFATPYCYWSLYLGVRKSARNLGGAGMVDPKRPRPPDDDDEEDDDDLAEEEGEG